MPVVITCPTCQRKSRIPDAALGKTVKCPGCGNSFTATGGDETPGRNAAESDDAPEGVSATPADDARRVERMGAGLLTFSQTAFALALALHLLLTLLNMMAADLGAKGSSLESLQQIVYLVAVLAGLTGAVTAMIGGIFGVVAPVFAPARAVAAAVLVMTIMVMVRDMTGPSLVSGANRFQLLAPAVFDSARQAMVAVYACFQARRLGDLAGARIAVFVAIGYSVVVIGLTALVIVVDAKTPHPTFDQVGRIGELLTKTILVAGNAFVLWRVWARLRSA